MTIFVKFNDQGYSIEMTNANPNSTEYLELSSEVMGKALIKEGDTVRQLTEVELEARLLSERATMTTKVVEAKALTLLKQSEFLSFPDVWSSYTDTQRTDVTFYRDFLRNIKTQQGFPLDIVWPELPNIGV